MHQIGHQDLLISTLRKNVICVSFFFFFSFSSASDLDQISIILIFIITGQCKSLLATFYLQFYYIY
jgi:hypothetical protein